MKVEPMLADQQAALLALKEYRQHRDVYDTKDWEIERIYRAISKGRTVISVRDAIVRAGLDEQKRPRLAVCLAHVEQCVCERERDKVVFSTAQPNGWPIRAGHIDVAWPGMEWGGRNLVARLPRIPPQHRPAASALSGYHILWEADWQDIPRDPYLLKRIGKDAWVVVAAWDLTDVEISVLRAHEAQGRH